MNRKLLLPLLFLATNCFSQDYLSVNYSQIYSSFNFTSSSGQLDKAITTELNKGYAANYQYQFRNGFFFRGELGYKEFGALASYNYLKLSWNFNYLDVNAGGGYIFDNYKFKPYAGISFYGSHLSGANLTIGGNYYDMLQNDSTKIKNNDFGINGFIGGIFPLTDITSIYLEITETKGFNQLEPSLNEKLYNTAFSFRLGVKFLFGKDLNRSKYDFMFK